MTNLLSPENHLFKLARSGQRLPHLILAVGLGFLIVLLAQFTGGVIGILINLRLSITNGEVNLATLDISDPVVVTTLLQPNTALEQVILLVFAFGPIFLLLWAWLALFEKRPLTSLGLERSGAGFKYLRGLAVGWLMFGAAIAISAAFGYIAFEAGDPQSQGLAALGGVLFVFLGWTVQGPAEEALTRGWLLPVIGARYNPTLGIIVSSLLFTVLHLLNPNLSLIAILNLFLFGLFASLYALYEGGLWGVFSLHAVWNWAQGNLFGLEVSGQPAPGGTLFNLREVGPDVVTGGPFGPEGGLAVTTVLLVSCGLVWWANRRQTAGPGPR